MHEVVVTGMGVVGPIGLDRFEFTENMFAGKSGLTMIRGSRVGHSFPIQMAGVLSNDPGPRHPEAVLPSELSRTENSALRATAEALADLPSASGIDAIVYATLQGTDFDLNQVFARALHPKAFPWSSTRSESCVLALRKLVEDRYSLPASDDALINITNACISSTQAIGIAFQRIRCGDWTRALVGGADARCDAATLMDFHMLHALSPDEGARASRPFSKTRNGFVMGEGAATLLLESRVAAELRGATILGKVSGFASTSDAFRISDGRSDAKSATHAMTRAMADARRSPAEIHAISAHGTSTPLNDRLESKAIRQALGSRAYDVPITALKSQIGHTTLASGAIQTVATFMMLREQRLSPTINFEGGDSECDLDYVPNESRAVAMKTILSNSFGFGGQNACLVLEAEDA